MPKPTYHFYLVTLIIASFFFFFREVNILGKVTFGGSIQSPRRWKGEDSNHCDQTAPGYL